MHLWSVLLAPPHDLGSFGMLIHMVAGFQEQQERTNPNVQSSLYLYAIANIPLAQQVNGWAQNQSRRTVEGGWQGDMNTGME